MEAFLCTMEKAVEEMSEEAFQKHIQALAIRRLDKPKKLSAECSKHWGEIISQQYNFDRGGLPPALSVLLCLPSSQTSSCVSPSPCLSHLSLCPPVSQHSSCLCCPECCDGSVMDLCDTVRLLTDVAALAANINTPGWWLASVGAAGVQLTVVCCGCCLADSVEVAYLKTLTKDSIMQFYRVSAPPCSHFRLFENASSPSS